MIVTKCNPHGAVTENAGYKIEHHLRVMMDHGLMEPQLQFNTTNRAYHLGTQNKKSDGGRLCGQIYMHLGVLDSQAFRHEKV